MSKIAKLKIFLNPSTLKIICIHTEGLKLQPEASKNQSPGPRPCETLVTALAAWTRLSQLRALSLSLHNTSYMCVTGRVGAVRRRKWVSSIPETWHACQDNCMSPAQCHSAICWQLEPIMWEPQHNMSFIWTCVACQRWVGQLHRLWLPCALMGHVGDGRSMAVVVEEYAWHGQYENLVT